MSVAASATPVSDSLLEAAILLLARGFWVIPTIGKRPYSRAWGAERWSEERLRAEWRPGAGPGICLGPGRAPCGGWLIDLEGDGPEADGSLLRLLGGEQVETYGWTSTRGSHDLFVADGDRLLKLLTAAGATEGKGHEAGKLQLADFPGLEFRVGRYGNDGKPLQFQSVAPPTPGTDGAPRRWNYIDTIAELPEAAYANLEAIGKRLARQSADQVGQSGRPVILPLGRSFKTTATTGPSVEERARAYARTIDPAISGQRGHDQIFYAACKIGPGFDLPPELAFRVIAEEYNQRCKPPWTEEEIRHKLDDAYKVETRRGWLLEPSCDEKQGDGSPQGRRKEKTPSQAEELIALGQEGQLFHDPSGRCYATVPNGGHRETHEIRSRGFRAWLKRRYWEECQRPPCSQAMQTALGMLEALATYSEDCEQVFLRVAHQGDKIYLDLGAPNWQAIEVDPIGWRVIPEAPVKFRRSGGMRPLPTPVPGASVQDLKPFLNVGDQDFLLTVAWLATAIRGVGPFPVLILKGEAGSAKSTMARVCRLLVDPSVIPLRAEPKENRDLMIGANNSWVLALDNLSRLPDWLSDAFCRIATGGGFATRELYADSEETLLDAIRPVILTGIDDIVTRNDLIDRSLSPHLPVIPDEKRRREANFWAEFEQAHPKLLGALLTLTADALKRLPGIKPARLPRMADFAVWGEAVSQAIGNPPNHFLTTYDAERKQANETVLDESPVAQELVGFLTGCHSPKWEGTASALLGELESRASDATKRRKGWPRSPRGLSGVLRRLAPSFRMTGLMIEFLDRTTSQRLISIKLESESKGDQPSSTVIPSSACNLEGQTNDGQGVQPSSNCHQPSSDRHTVIRKSRKKEADDRHDGHDGRAPSFSNLQNDDGWEEF